MKALHASLARNGPPDLSGAPKDALILSALRAKTKVQAEVWDTRFLSAAPAVGFSADSVGQDNTLSQGRLRCQGQGSPWQPIEPQPWASADG